MITHSCNIHCILQYTLQYKLYITKGQELKIFNIRFSIKYTNDNAKIEYEKTKAFSSL